MEIGRIKTGCWLTTCEVRDDGNLPCVFFVLDLALRGHSVLPTAGKPTVVLTKQSRHLCAHRTNLLSLKVMAIQLRVR